MAAPFPSQITTALETLIDPYLGEDLVKAKVVQEIAVFQNEVSLRLLYPYPNLRQLNSIKEKIQALFNKHWPECKLSLDIQFRAKRHKVQPTLKPKSEIKNIIAVASGKGGVGKSTVATNLAVALSKLGARVALLDADLYGPSQPRMLGKEKVQAQVGSKKWIPVESYGVQSISIGYLVEEDTPVIWRGPMASNALQQLLNETAWKACDYMILDLPPGTGDIQLTMAQKLPISAAVIVTTPQDIALLDAKKAYHMFCKVGVPVLGVVENMSVHKCVHCGEQEAIFGEGGGRRLAKQYNLPLLGQLPLTALTRKQSDQGVPIVLNEDAHLSQPFWEMAQKVAAQLAQCEVEHTAVISSVVVS